ncbi:hypothetical protein [Streptomyces albireticuli]|uniref:Uncharacterized protein n=1 Tax=Streptomyces albireticuli TaxID=1940 RepID=A0A2A2DDU1_9ACTN|nr:hypothetical protein [Streptomyces albireticuli]MCD9140681.1 hypothetical protein [Streptomyces albireticuli]MCD9161357.1 hypothetical protein [Streptomyces albireticuli]MCD9190585.1 hypothetical protein [Streptomyces albireticuli]PAU49694.1 hypothetical protein CK936_06425 [Streptomyces albireticuli]
MDQTVYYVTVAVFLTLMAALGAYAIKRLSNRPRALAAVLLALTAVIGAFPPVIRALAPPPAAVTTDVPAPSGRAAPGGRS